MINPLLEKAIEVYACAKYMRNNVSPLRDAASNWAIHSLVSQHLTASGVGRPVIQLLVPDPDAWGF